MKGLWMLLGVLVLVYPVVGVPITFTENWDSYANTNPPAGPWYVDTHMTAGGCFVGGNNVPHSSPLSYRVTDASYTGGNDDTRGNQALIAPVGQSVEATDASPLALSYWEKSRKYRFTDFFIELSLGDTHAPAYSTTALAETIPVIGFGKPYIETVVGYGAPYTKWLSFFDGKQWRNPGCYLTQDASWEQLLMSVGSTEVTLDTSKHADATDIAYTLARQYTGEFDRITIYTRWDNIDGGWTQIDDISLTGGNLVPEPAALTLLGLGCLFVLRRR